MTTTSQTDWVLASERKPKRATRVSVTVPGYNKRCKPIVSIGVWWTVGQGHDGEDGWQVEGYDEFQDVPVIAWKPLPEAYVPKK